MSFAICCVPVSPLRATPSHRSEIVSQLVFGEQCFVTAHEKDNWVQVRCNYDQYEGWCQEAQIMLLEMSLPGLSPLTTDWVSLIEYNGAAMYIPYASQIPGLTDGTARWNDVLIRYGGSLANSGSYHFNESGIKQASFPFLNTSYLWGGKSVFGVDCSGFCQTVFKFFNIAILRDASQQATQGESVGFLQEARCGDLAFFDNSEGRITHVGILLNESEILHASVKVRIDHIDNMGIINTDTGVRTHQLRLIKRYYLPPNTSL